MTRRNKKIYLPSVKKPLFDYQIIRYAEKYKVPYFRGIFFRDTLPRTSPRVNESAVINLDLIKNPGTHWVCYIKRKSTIWYFDPLGNVSPPVEILKYFGSKNEVYYNFRAQQSLNAVNCGHLCLRYLIAGPPTTTTRKRKKI